MKVAFIGLGIMGSRMAANLLRAGHTLTVHNRTRAKAEPLLAEGAQWAASPAEAAAEAEVAVTMLAEPGAVSRVALGEQGLLTGLPAGTVWLDCSTGNPTFARQMAAAAGMKRVRFLDAPVAGSRGPAEQGQLTFLVGGEADDVEAVRPLLDAMGQKVVHVGAHGMGTSMKMVFNLVLGQSMLAFCEALVLGESLGLPRSQLLESLGASPLVAPYLGQAKAQKIAGDDFEPDFPLKWMQKDLQMVTTAAYESGVALPGTGVAKDAYALAARHGLGERDFAAIYAFLAHRVGD